MGYYFDADGRMIRTFHKSLFAMRRAGANSRGIKFELTILELAYLFKRDGAGHMSKPALDRICVSHAYALWNCRFMEMPENTRRNGRGMSRIYTKEESKSVVIRLGRGQYNAIKRKAFEDGRTVKKTLELVIADGIQLPIHIKESYMKSGKVEIK